LNKNLLRWPSFYRTSLKKNLTPPKDIKTILGVLMIRLWLYAILLSSYSPSMLFATTTIPQCPGSPVPLESMQLGSIVCSEFVSVWGRGDRSTPALEAACKAALDTCQNDYTCIGTKSAGPDTYTEVYAGENEEDPPGSFKGISCSRTVTCCPLQIPIP